jgi:hypothetical protein
MRYTRESKKIKKQGVAGAGGGSSSLFTRVTRETVLYLSNKKKLQPFSFLPLLSPLAPFFLKETEPTALKIDFP